LNIIRVRKVFLLMLVSKLTADGSFTLYNEALNEHYHSVHGAVQESNHVFIKHGLQYKQTQQKILHILEIGFGTGLNAFLSCINSTGNAVHYTALETIVLPLHQVKDLGYASDPAQQELFERLHLLEWEKELPLNEHFFLCKKKEKVQNIKAAECYDLIYYDAFGPRAQPDMWTDELFEKMYCALLPGGALVTYCAMGEVKRMLKRAGFTVEELPGPPGKREMTRALKPSEN
jgi:tRNA U34 5-methylaminomethyl-2-thiouridine-forming methyltransferase MnmC